MKKNIRIFLFLFLSVLAGETFAQCDSTAYYAKQYLNEKFISDGQTYRALIFDDQIAEFNTTFYGGSKYRIVAFAGMEKDQLQFSLFDQDGNTLFINASHNNAPYWDFEVQSTIEGRIEAKLDLTKQKSGCAVLLIGFER